MKIHEYQAKELFRIHNIAVLRGGLSEAAGSEQVAFLHPKGTFGVLAEF